MFFGVDLNKIELSHIQENKPNPELFQLATRKKFQEVDWFVSHSWRDSPVAKFQALQAARAQFQAEHKREPVVWLDKFCLDQDAIEANLMCLPVFLAACKQLVIMCGPTCECPRPPQVAPPRHLTPVSRTDLERLWCVLELFVWIEMGGKIEDVELYFIPPDTGVDASHEASVLAFYEAKFENFEVANAACYDPVQRDRLLAVVEAGFGGLEGFNVVLKKTMAALRKKAAPLSTSSSRRKSVFTGSPAASTPSPKPVGGSETKVEEIAPPPDVQAATAQAAP